MNRRTFIKTTSLAGAIATLAPIASSPLKAGLETSLSSPLVINTWDYGQIVPETAYKTIIEGGSVLDAVEKAVRIPEADPKITSVGLGGYPDRDGHVSLDASIMNGDGSCGSVVFLEHIMHPVSVARLVMEKTPHIMLAGEGALQFALENGFRKEKNQLGKDAKKDFQKWLKESKYKRAIVDKGNHDTIGLLAMDTKGNMAGACSTSGMAWKLHGRVGDSPIIGAGLYVDNEIGGATATGVGEAAVKMCGSFYIVELMRQGKSPGEACRLAVEKIFRKLPQYKQEKGFVLGFCAFNKNGEHGGYSYRNKFEYSVYRDGKFEIIKPEYMTK